MHKEIIPAIPKKIFDRISKNLVEPGATVLPGSECSDYPEGIPLPEGLRVRTVKGVELRFILDDERISETVRGRPTVAFVLEVARKRVRIQQLIGLGKFGEEEYREEFPGSHRLKETKEEVRPVTVGEALEDWYISRQNTFGPNTDKDYVRAIRNQLIPMKLPGGMIRDDDYVPPRPDYAPPQEWSLSRYEGGPVRSVDPSDTKILGHLAIHCLTDVTVNAIRTQLLCEVGIKRVNNIMAPLRGAIERQVAMKMVSVNPFDLVKPLKKTEVVLDDSDKSDRVSNRRRGKPLDQNNLDLPLPDDETGSFLQEEGDPDPLSVDDVFKVLSELDAPMKNQLTFAFWTGLRTGELIGLRVSDLQLENDRILIRRSVSRGIQKTTKTDKQRWVHLLPPAKAALLAQIKLMGAPGGWVFPNPFTRERWANESKITKRWTRALEKAGVRYRKPYQTRHTYASMLLSAGENIMYVAGQMGHADWSMLVKVYGRWLPSGAGTQAGAMVTTANINNWEHLGKLIDAGDALAAAVQ